eukprot:8583988-Pyramimonas_sp.AAC.2
MVANDLKCVQVYCHWTGRGGGPPQIPHIPKMSRRLTARNTAARGPRASRRRTTHPLAQRLSATQGQVRHLALNDQVYSVTVGQK